jgi:hypothetical protein
MTKEEARDAVMAATQRAFAVYDAQHGGILRGMTRAQMYAYAGKRTEFANSMLMRDVPLDIRMLAV